MANPVERVRPCSAGPVEDDALIFSAHKERQRMKKSEREDGGRTLSDGNATQEAVVKVHHALPGDGVRVNIQTGSGMVDQVQRQKMGEPERGAARMAHNEAQHGKARTPGKQRDTNDKEEETQR